jgi:glycosyltransferase involved in cell wall biosynthesis
VVLYSGRLGGEKSLDVLLRAFAIVAKKTRASLVLSGSGPDAGILKDLAGQLGISRITHFVGFVPDNDFPSLYGIASMFAIPSTAELQSIVTLEALASGLPVVAADSNALPELVHHGKNGFLHKPFDPPGMAVFLERLLRNPSLRARMGAESLRIVAKHDYPQVFKTFEKLYRQVIESHKAAARRS